MSGIFGNSISMMEKSLDYLWLRQSVTSDNIANVDTVGYKAKYVTFEEAFQAELDRAIGMGDTGTVAETIAAAEAIVSEADTESLRLDGNNVNLEVELIELTRTSFQYRYLLDSVSSDITRLRTAITG